MTFLENHIIDCLVDYYISIYDNNEIRKFLEIRRNFKTALMIEFL